MMMEEQTPHVVMFPFPVQGHIKPFLCLAELLSKAGIRITFINTHRNHRRMGSSLGALAARFPNLRFEVVADGFPDDQPRRVKYDMIFSMKTVTKPHFKDLLLSIGRNNNNNNNNKEVRPVTCIIADTLMSFPVEVAEELNIPIIAFRTPNAHYLWACFNIPNLIEQGQVPFTDNNISGEIHGVPALKGLLRKELPSFCKAEHGENPILEFFINEIQTMKRASAFIVNTFKDIESSCLPHIACLFPKLYIVGPLHALSTSNQSNGSLWKEEDGCLTWLDSQPSRSVLYVSFGSLVKVTRDQLMEFWHALVHSGHRFLMILRPDLLVGSDIKEQVISFEIELGTTENGCVVGWAPQERVLGHKAVGGFLTHGGWNSVLEGIVAGVPLICWPHFYDQHIISRYVGQVWKIGIELEACDRTMIETTIRRLMETEKEILQKSIDTISKLAWDSVSPGGSSYQNLEMLVQDIKNMKSKY